MGKVILTGDRPTGKLHLGHYVGYCAAASNCRTLATLTACLYLWLTFRL